MTAQMKLEALLTMIGNCCMFEISFSLCFQGELLFNLFVINIYRIYTEL